MNDRGIHDRPLSAGLNDQRVHLLEGHHAVSVIVQGHRLSALSELPHGPEE